MKHLRVSLLGSSALAILLSGAPSYGSQPASPCLKSATTQLALDRCADRAALREQNALAKVYAALLATASHTPGAVTKIKAQEREWELYRKSCLEAMFPLPDKQVHYGTMYPMEADFAFASVTHDRVAELQKILNFHTRGEGER